MMFCFKTVSLEVDPPFFTFCAELHAALLAAVELEAALGPCDVTTVAREVVIFQSCDADGIVVLEAPNDVVARVRLADIVRRLEEGRTHRRPAGSRETCQKRACSAHTLNPADPVSSP